MNGDWIPGYFELWNAHDSRGVSERFAEDGLYQDVALGIDWRGRAEIEEVLRLTASMFSSDFRTELVRYGQDGDVWCAEWFFSGTHDSAAEGFRALGEPFRFTIATIGTVRDDGLITLKRDVHDPRTTLDLRAREVPLA